MADIKVTDLAAISGLTGDDLVMIVDSPASGSASKKITMTNFVESTHSLLPEATAEAKGLMSAADKTFTDSIKTGTQQYMLLFNASGNLIKVPITGDITIDVNGVVSIGAAKITGGKIATGTITTGNIATAAAIDLYKLANQTAGYIVAANSSGVLRAVAISGDVTIDTSGVITIGAAKVTGSKIATGTITTGNIGTNAGIELYKLVHATAAQVPVFNGSGVLAAATISGDATISSSGAVTVSKANLIFNSDLKLPHTIYVPIGRELNLYYDNLTSNANNMNGVVAVIYNSVKGASRHRYWRYTPSVEETFTLTVGIFDRNGNVLSSDTCTITSILDERTETGNKQILFIGDSMTAAQTMVTEVHTLMTAAGDDVTLVGTKGSTGNKHEGISGWEFDDFIGASSPFYIGGQIDFDAYITANGTGALDYVFIQLGTNDVYNEQPINDADIAQIIVEAEQLIDYILADFPSCRIILGFPPKTPNNRYGWGTPYFTKESYDRAMHKFWTALITNFDEGTYSAQVRLAINGMMLDRDYGFPLTTVNASARITSVQEVVSNDNVHPSTEGYKQMADAYYSAYRKWSRE